VRIPWARLGWIPYPVQGSAPIHHVWPELSDRDDLEFLMAIQFKQFKNLPGALRRLGLRESKVENDVSITLMRGSAVYHSQRAEVYVPGSRFIKFAPQYWMEVLLGQERHGPARPWKPMSDRSLRAGFAGPAPGEKILVSRESGSVREIEIKRVVGKLPSGQWEIVGRDGEPYLIRWEKE